MHHHTHLYTRQHQSAHTHARTQLQYISRKNYELRSHISLLNLVGKNEKNISIKCVLKEKLGKCTNSLVKRWRKAPTTNHCKLQKL